MREDNLVRAMLNLTTAVSKAGLGGGQLQVNIGQMQGGGRAGGQAAGAVGFALGLQTSLQSRGVTVVRSGR